MTIVALLAFASVGGAVPASASDAVLYWNEVATNTVLPRGPAGFVDLAKVQIAVHDAVQAFEHRYEPYCASIGGATGSPSAAVATAAHDVLIALLPAAAATLGPVYSGYLSDRGLLTDPGIEVGRQAAACILELRRFDGAFPNPAPVFFGEASAGVWRSATSMVQPWLGAVEPFAIREATQFRHAPGPPRLTSGLYTRDYNEVKELGAKVSAVRTTEQTELARFYSDNLIAIWHRTLRTIVANEVGEIGDQARLFALASIAAADGLIRVWDSKLYWALWRPITAIHEGDDDGNPRTAGDPLWEPYLAAPNYPEYSSGANVIFSAMARIVESYLRSGAVTFDVESRAGGMTTFRTYQRLSDLTQDMVDVRVYQGIHFRFGDEAGYRQGLHTANWTFSHVLRPETPR